MQMLLWLLVLLVLGVTVPGTGVGLCAAECKVVLGFKSIEGPFGVYVPD